MSAIGMYIHTYVHISTGNDAVDAALFAGCFCFSSVRERERLEFVGQYLLKDGKNDNDKKRA